MSEHRHLLKSASIITTFTFISRIFGYIRDNRVAFLLGADTAGDAFTLAFRIPNLLRRLVGEGAVSAAVIPELSRQLVQEDRKKLWEFANTLFTILTLTMTAVTILGIVFSPFLVHLFGEGFQGTPGKIELTTYLNRIMFPFIFFISLSAFAMGILNSFHRFAAPAFAPVLLNLSVITASFFAAGSDEPAVGLAVGVVIGGFLQFAIQLPPLLRTGWLPRLRLRFNDAAVRGVGRRMGPVVLGTGIAQVNVFVDSIFASYMVEGAMTSIYLADRVMELVLGGYTIAIATAILPLLSRQAAEHRMPEMKQTLNFATRIVLLITLPATVGLIVLRQPIIEVLFRYGEFSAEDTVLTAWALLFFAIGLSAFSMIKIIVPAFYAMHDTATPAIVALMAMFVNIGLNYVFFEPLQNGGPPLATALAAFFNAAALMAIFYRRQGSFGVRSIAQSLSKFGIAAAVMGLVAYSVIQIPEFYVNQPQPQKIVALGLTIVAAGLTYFGAAYLLRVTEIGEVLALVAQRRSRRTGND